jgi:2-polyprenyl-3-methyl-5-hydroxy-6-metoxy-1,4-benzoquinol methylase
MANNYLQALLQSDKYGTDKQIQLKRRVFSTFNTLLTNFGQSPMTEGKKLLDLGAADGSLGKVAQQDGVEASSLDVSDGINFETDRLPFEDQIFDVVTAVSLIEHLYSPGVMLSEIMRVLKPGGAFIAVTPNWRYCYKFFYDDPTHVHPYSQRSLAFLFSSAGFEPVTVVPWLVCKPSWMWTMPMAFQIARILPFRWSPNPLIPEFLKGRSTTLLALAEKPQD